MTDHAVRLTSVTFVAPPASLRVLNVYAYSYKYAVNGLIGEFGDLPEECPREYRPHPLSDAVAPPHRDAPWLVVIAFTISRPGVFHLNRVRVDYVTKVTKAGNIRT